MTRVMLLVVMAASLTLAVGVNPASATITEQQAKDSAVGLAAALGWQYGPPSAAEVKAPFGSHGEEFRVDFSGSAEICLEARTGELTSAVDYSQVALLSRMRPLEEKLGEEEARQAAERWLDVLGRPTGIQLKHAEQARDNRRWVFVWARTFQGIPYISDAMRIEVSPIDGRLMLFGKGFICAPPPTVEVKLTEAEAIASSRQHAADLGLADEAARPASAELMVVQQNDYWEEEPILNSRYPGAPSRVAWVVTLGEEGGYWKQFWLDAADGRLLGGMQTLGGPRPKAQTAGAHGPQPQGGEGAATANRWIVVGPASGVVAVALIAVGLQANRRRRRPRAGSS